MIPKVLHYCWFGGGEMPDLVTECIESWSRVWPDYEIIKWDENNCHRSPYIEKALEKKRWANASNLARFYALRQGGIYVDVDVEAIRDWGDLLERDLIIGWQDKKLLNNAVLGIVPEHPFIEYSIEKFEARFNSSERPDKSSPNFVTEMVRGYYGDLKIALPREYLYPRPFGAKRSAKWIKNETVCVHHWMASWQ
jgi:mannosyltransferase OCH1-like enzyme